MMYPTNPCGYFNNPEPSLDEPASAWDGLRQVCGFYDPAPLCGVCTRERKGE